MRLRQRLLKNETFLWIFLSLCGFNGLFAADASGQGYVFGVSQYAVSPGAVSVATADFNRDGRLDLAVVDSGCFDGSRTLPNPCVVSILLGKPDGTFGPKADYTVAGFPTQIVIGDFNGDGIPDLAVAGGTLSILLGNGDGTFQPPLQAPALGYFIVAGDFNGDGKLDLAVCGPSANVHILLGNGDGSFRKPPTSSYTVGTSAVLGITAGDFNGDGKLDLAVSGGVPGVSILLGNGDGTFRSSVEYVTGRNSGPVASADFNGDGRLDLAVGGDGGVSILLGNGDGTFQPFLDNSWTSFSFSIGPIQNPLNIFWVGVSDFNGDGKVDLVAGSQSGGGGLFILLGKGDGTFQTHVDYTFPMPQARYYSGFGALPTVSTLAIGDFNGDGKPDLATVNGRTNTAFVALNVGDGTFQHWARVAGSSGTGAMLGAGGFNNDGNVDLVAGPGTNIDTNLYILLGSAAGVFQSPLPVSIGFPAVGLAVGDFNKDGKLDFAALNGFSSAVAVFLGNGDGTFRSAGSFATGQAPVAIAAGDFNRDGSLDLVVANYNAGTVSILLGNGDGTFKFHVDYFTGPNPQSVAKGDLNGDGNLDLVVGTTTGTSILLGNGDGSFQAYTSLAGIYGPVLGDFNADGKLDLATETTNGVAVLLGNGDGTFKPPLNSVFGFGVQISFAADVNGDGKLDLLGAGSGLGVDVELGNGDGTFQPPVRVPYTAFTFGIPVVADFNRDGALDLAIAGEPGFGSGVTLVSLDFPVIALYPSSIAFPGLGVGHSASQTILVSNPGSMPLNISSILQSGFGFTLDNSCGSVISSRGNCTLTVTFTPSTTSATTGVITLIDNARSSPQVIPLVGTGVTGPFAELSPSSVNFGAGFLGSTSAVETVRLTNTGNAALTISTISTSSTNFSQTNQCGSGLAAGASCTVNLTFTPAAVVGTAEGSLVITDNAPNAPQTVALIGTSLVPPLSVSFSADFDADVVGDITVWRPSTGEWRILPSNGSAILAPIWGTSGDVPVPGDYDGDRKTDLGIWRPSTGEWWVRASSTGALIYKQFGTNGDIPVPGDYDGDGKTDIAVWRPSTGSWFITPSSNPASQILVHWGASGDIPVPGDYDGDGKTDIAVWRPSTGEWWILASSTGALIYRQFGTNGDIPVPADYDGDRKTDIALWRPSTGSWFIIPSANPAIQIVVNWGTSGDVPVPGDYNGDGKADIAIWRPSTATWWIIPSGSGGTIVRQWGAPTDIPMNKPVGQ